MFKMVFHVWFQPDGQESGFPVCYSKVAGSVEDMLQLPYLQARRRELINVPSTCKLSCNKSFPIIFSLKCSLNFLTPKLRELESLSPAAGCSGVSHH